MISKGNFFISWIACGLAACLAVLGIWQGKQILDLEARLLAANTDADHLRHSNSLLGLELELLEAKDAAYASAKVMVAWDPYEHRGVVSVQDLPVTPAGHDYQLWVLDPNASGPISAGVITGTRPFQTGAVSTQNPGFAVSLEPSGGSPSSTGPILFAVAPGS